MLATSVDSYVIKSILVSVIWYVAWLFYQLEPVLDLQEFFEVIKYFHTLI